MTRPNKDTFRDLRYLFAMQETEIRCNTKALIGCSNAAAHHYTKTRYLGLMPNRHSALFSFGRANKKKKKLQPAISNLHFSIFPPETPPLLWPPLPTPGTIIKNSSFFSPWLPRPVLGRGQISNG